jgi:hypothetical protein
MTNVESKVGKYRTIKDAVEFIQQNLLSPTAARSVTSFLSAKARAGEKMFLEALKEHMLRKSMYGTRSEEQIFQKTLDAFGGILDRYIETAAQ